MSQMFPKLPENIHTACAEMALAYAIKHDVLIGELFGGNKGKRRPAVRAREDLILWVMGNIRWRSPTGKIEDREYTLDKGQLLAGDWLKPSLPMVAGIIGLDHSAVKLAIVRMHKREREEAAKGLDNAIHAPTSETTTG